MWSETGETKTPNRNSNVKNKTETTKNKNNKQEKKPTTRNKTIKRKPKEKNVIEKKTMKQMQAFWKSFNTKPKVGIGTSTENRIVPKHQARTDTVTQ